VRGTGAVSEASRTSLATQQRWWGVGHDEAGIYIGEGRGEEGESGPAPSSVTAHGHVLLGIKAVTWTDSTARIWLQVVASILPSWGAERPFDLPLVSSL
jgi:hypothetical protein